MLGILAAILLQGAPAPRPSVITMPDWLQKPTAADMQRYYPAAAILAHVDGRAVIGCTVTADGFLNNCRVISEDPPVLGFGDAALQISTLFRMRPMTKDGAPVDGGRVNIPIRFIMPAAPAPQGAIVQPQWERRPLPQDFAREYPRGALQKRISGRATLRCDVLATGQLGACAVIEETPRGEGFGAAALRMATLFHMRPQTVNGQPRGAGQVNIPIEFTVPGGAMNPYTAALRCYGRTAVAAERDRGARDLVGAARIWSSQAFDQGAASNIPPEQVERALTNAHRAAMDARNNVPPSLGECLDNVRHGRPKP